MSTVFDYEVTEQDIEDILPDEVVHVWMIDWQQFGKNGPKIAVCGVEYEHFCVPINVTSTTTHCFCGTPLCSYCRLLLFSKEK